MIKLTRLWGALAAFVLTTFLAVPASAQASRTWVSGVGDDANPCSRTAPCKTWAGAISKTAAGGEIDALDPGGYGALTITKSIIIDGGGGIGGQVASTLVSGTNGFVVSAGASDVVKIRNMTFNGLSHSVSPGLSGIKFLSGGGLIVEHVGIFEFGGTATSNGGIDFEPSAASTLNMLDVEIQFGLADGVLIKPGAAGSVVASLNHVSAMSNGGSGLNVNTQSVTSGPGVTATVINSNLSINTNGVLINGKSGFTAKVLMTGSSLNGNSNRGAFITNPGALLGIGGDTISGNATGLVANSGATISSFGDNYVFGNGADGTPNGSPFTKE